MMQQHPSSERLQKVLAQLGLGSRRTIESWIADGKVKVNGKPAVLGCKVSVHDNISVQGRVIKRSHKPKETRILLYHKPTGEVTTRNDPEGRPTVFDKLPKLRGQRWIAVGRLDINSSGLLLLTTDGELANNLMHPYQEIPREYAVRLLGEPDTAVCKQAQQGVKLDDGTPAKFDKVVKKGGEGVNTWVHVTLKQGRYREVRRIWAALGFTVNRLIRVRYGNQTLPRYLRRGTFEELSATAVKRFKQQLSS